MSPIGSVKYVVVTGGVISGVGKGIIASSTGVLLKSLGLRVTAIKIDPYLNIDAGTLREVYTLDDGGEVDLDLGNYERFLDITLTQDNNVTTGKIYQQVIERERRGDYLGKTVQVVPHVSDAIQDWIERVGQLSVDNSGLPPDVCIVELGGTVGDIESAPFVEALRQFQFRVGRERFALIHVSLVPAVGSTGEQKTKPTQHSVQLLRGAGLAPDLIACRSATPLESMIKSKISMFCHVPPGEVVTVYDCKTIFDVPLLLEKQGVLDFLRNRLDITPRSPTMSYLSSWRQIAKELSHFIGSHLCLEGLVKIALVGKYTYLQDSYLSVCQALKHASVACGKKLEIIWIEATDLETPGSDKAKERFDNAWLRLKETQAILVPGGFGERGTEGKIAALKYARTSNIPMLGLCLGFQMAVIEYARNVMGLIDANSTEMNATTPYPVVVNMPEVSKTHMGGTMRLGLRVSRFVKPESKSRRLYEVSEAEPVIHERHRHRYEVNPEFVPQLEEAGLTFVARDETGQRMEILELSDHPYYIATQFHPEFKSRVMRPSPLFVGLIKAAMGESAPL